MGTVKNRIASLTAFFEDRESSNDSFRCEDGSIFSVDDALDYLRRNGSTTPDGRHISCYVRPNGIVDSLSVSLCDFIDEIIAKGWNIVIEGDDL